MKRLKIVKYQYQRVWNPENDQNVHFQHLGHGVDGITLCRDNLGDNVRIIDHTDEDGPVVTCHACLDIALYDEWTE
jgi:hypothetical protein